ncbi:MAG: hypothetical protein DMG42_02020 [Acidobacteria bacterium]|nr:MAG: hypothetical protein AUH13_05555 [Acidobacteria bacterium 13_2_20CM_58_27]PYT77735.1 MAG: hypothetical protein DMG42_02020 [Acidobacteriota bacterium]
MGIAPPFVWKLKPAIENSSCDRKVDRSYRRIPFLYVRRLVENHTELLDSVVTIGFDSKDCDADYRMITSRGAEPIEAPQDRPWDARTAYVKGPGGLTVEIEQLLSDTSR